MGLPARALAVAIHLAAAAGPTRACTSFVFNCGTKDVPEATVSVRTLDSVPEATDSARTLDFGGDLTALGTIDWLPAGPFNGTALAKGGTRPSWQFKHGMVATHGGVTAGQNGVLCDGMNDAGLAVATNWQSNVSFHKRYDAASPAPTAMTVVDLPFYALGMFSTVAEVKAFLDPAKVQLTTDIQDPAQALTLKFVLGSDPDIPPADADGTFYFALHYHFMDASGAGLLVEGSPDGGVALYDTKVVTNEPAFPAMEAWAGAYTSFNFSAVPGVGPSPAFAPAIIPFNSGLNAAATGYLGSQSRFLRTLLAIANCSAYPWPKLSWSPGAPDASADPPPAAFRALKRGENYLAAVVVPMSQLGGLDPTHGTQMMFLRDHDAPAYYFKTPRYNAWRSVDLAALAQAGAPAQRFSIAPRHARFATAATAAS